MTSPSTAQVLSIIKDEQQPVKLDREKENGEGDKGDIEGDRERREKATQDEENREETQDRDVSRAEVCVHLSTLER